MEDCDVTMEWAVCMCETVRLRREILQLQEQVQPSVHLDLGQ